MRLANILLFLLVLIETESAALQSDEVRHTRLTLNYRIETLYRDSNVIKKEIYDIHSGKPVENQEYVSLENTKEERYEDSENLMVIQYDLNGKQISRKSYKKSTGAVGEIELTDDQIRALEKYDLEDEELPIMKIDWEEIIFADKNFSHEYVVRWSQTDHYMVKTQYSREGLILKRQVWNRLTGQKFRLDHKVYSEVIEKDIIQNHAGFLEVSYNTLGKVRAIRSWDRNTGRVLSPPRALPFSNRLEVERLDLNYEEHKQFEEDFFQVKTTGKKVEIKPGESLFNDEKKEYTFLKSVSVGGIFGGGTSGKVGYGGKGQFDNSGYHPFVLRAHLVPGKIDIYNRVHWGSYTARVNGNFQVKNTNYLYGSEMSSEQFNWDAYSKKTLYTRDDAQLDLLYGLRLNYHDIEFRDGSRKTGMSELTLVPTGGFEASWFPNPGRSVYFNTMFTKFHVGGVDTEGMFTTVEYRHKAPESLMKLMKSGEVVLGYRNEQYKLTTDTDTLSEVLYDTSFSGTFVEFRSNF
jgi:hypothetical protein